MRKIRYGLYHITLILALMYIVFFCIDRVNTAMMFINNDITKWLLLVMSVLTIFNTLQFIFAERERLRRRLARQQQSRSARRR